MIRLAQTVMVRMEVPTKCLRCGARGDVAHGNELSKYLEEKCFDKSSGSICGGTQVRLRWPVTGETQQ
jgi:hypothetical protein